MKALGSFFNRNFWGHITWHFQILIDWAQGGVIDIESMPENVQKELQVSHVTVGENFSEFFFKFFWNFGQIFWTFFENFENLSRSESGWKNLIQARNATLQPMNQSTDMDMEMDDEKGKPEKLQ